MLDLNRGVMQKTHPNGFLVGMYLDEPGVFYTEDGTECPENDAREAGFDVTALLEEKKKHEALAEARRKVEQEFEAKKDAIEQESAPAPKSTARKSTRKFGRKKAPKAEAKPAESKVGKLTVVGSDDDGYAVLDEDGVSLISGVKTEAAAQEFAADYQGD